MGLQPLSFEEVLVSSLGVFRFAKVTAMMLPRCLLAMFSAEHWVSFLLTYGLRDDVEDAALEGDADFERPYSAASARVATHLTLTPCQAKLREKKLEVAREQQLQDRSREALAAMCDTMRQPTADEMLEVPFVQETWMVLHHYSVEVVGQLAAEGMNGAVTVLSFTPSLEEGDTPEGTLFAGLAVHKASAMMASQVPGREPYFTKLMSEACGLSVGYVGSLETDTDVHMLVEFIPSLEALHWFHRKYLDAELQDAFAPQSVKYQADFLGSFDATGFTDEISRFILTQFAFILKSLKEGGVIHRDIKPENLIFPSWCESEWRRALRDWWVQSDCIFTLIDYGLACLDGEAGRSGDMTCGPRFQGTYAYAAPETAPKRGGNFAVGFAADMFQMGIVAWMALCQSRQVVDWPPAVAFSSATGDNRARAKAMKKVLHDPRLPATIEHELGNQPLKPETRAIVMRMLDMDPSTRITADELWDHPALSESRPLVERLSARVLKGRAGRIYLE